MQIKSKEKAKRYSQERGNKKTNTIQKITENVINILSEETKKKSLTPNLQLAELIEKNIKGEADARMMYYELLQYLEDEKDVEVLEEIISDELNHTMLLNKMLKKYSKISIAKD